MGAEQDFADIVIGRLKKYFKVESEAWSKCGKNRIDYILLENKTGFPFGIEFKQVEEKRGEEIGEHILQGMRYAQSEFKINGVWQRIPILICPPISFNYLQAPIKRSMKIDAGVFGRDEEFYHDRHPRDATHHTCNGMLGALGLGEIRSAKREDYKTKKENQYMRFVFSNKILWDEAPEYLQQEPKGIHLTNYAFQISKPINYAFK